MADTTEDETDQSPDDQPRDDYDTDLSVDEDYPEAEIVEITQGQGGPDDDDNVVDAAVQTPLIQGVEDNEDGGRTSAAGTASAVSDLTVDNDDMVAFKEKVQSFQPKDILEVQKLDYEPRCGSECAIRGQINAALTGLKKKYPLQKRTLRDNLLSIVFPGEPVDETKCERLSICRDRAIPPSEIPPTSPHRCPLPNVILGYLDVVCNLANGDVRQLKVTVERQTTYKPFLGGYRDTRTGTVYHNAQTQSIANPRRVPKKREDETQTSEIRNVHLQTTNTTSTQMTGIGIYMKNIEDRRLTPKPYKTADYLEGIRNRNVLLVQKQCRGWLARRRVRKIRERIRVRLEYEAKQTAMREEIRSTDLGPQKLANPKSRSDFEFVFSILEKWRQGEVDRIENTVKGEAEHHAALDLLLIQEQRIIRCIDKRKLLTAADSKEVALLDFFNKCALPKCIQGEHGGKTLIDSPNIERARALKEIHNVINMKFLTVDERLDALLSLKNTVKEHPCSVSADIIELVDREADLLLRGFTEGRLDGLRKRIDTLFTQYCKMVEFNPAAAPHLRVPFNKDLGLQSTMHRCLLCGRNLPLSSYELAVNQYHFNNCKSCKRLLNEGGQRNCALNFNAMLTELRRSELSFNDGSKAAWLFQDTDLQYLVMYIWEGKSIISQSDDIRDLIVARWNRCIPWSPANCVVLTKDEADVHIQLQDPALSYDIKLLDTIRSRQAQGTKYFSGLRALDAKYHPKRTLNVKPPFTINEGSSNRESDSFNQ